MIFYDLIVVDRGLLARVKYENGNQQCDDDPDHLRLGCWFLNWLGQLNIGLR